MTLEPSPLPEFEILITGTFFNGGPKDGTKAKIKFTEDLKDVTFNTWSARRESYHRGRNVSNALYWDATVQSTWPTSVLRRGIAEVEDHPILFARRLHTTRFETYEVVALKRGAGFTATAIPGFVFRLNTLCTFDTDRNRGKKRLLKMVRAHTLALLNGDATLT